MHQNPATRGSAGKGRLGTDGQRASAGSGCNPAGSPPLDAWFDHHDTWTLTTQPSSLAHYAMWPAKLAERLILSMCPEFVCATCGEPRRRVEKATLVDKRGLPVGGDWYATVGAPTEVNGRLATGKDNTSFRSSETLGWTDCGHDNYRPGHVLDPFGGTGTTGAVAHLHGRDATLIDIDSRNAAMYPARLDECRRTLFGVKPELPGQEALFG
jgi:hypothetical protein